MELWSGTPVHMGGNPYIGGPNITPPYHSVTGDIQEGSRSDSSSNSDSSPTYSDTKYNIKDGQDMKHSVRLGKDEKIARQAGIKFDVKQDIVNPPMDEFNDMLSREELSEEQLNICRDIRRRGKNKVAAQNCRKRKLEQIDELQKKVEEAKRRQYRLKVEHESLLANYVSEAERFPKSADQFRRRLPSHEDQYPSTGVMYQH